MNIIAQRLRQLRSCRGLTQEQLARLVGLSAYTIAGYESGKPAGSANVWKLAEFFGVSYDYLCGREHTSAIDVDMRLDERQRDKIYRVVQLATELMSENREEDGVNRV